MTTRIANEFFHLALFFVEKKEEISTKSEHFLLLFFPVETKYKGDRPGWYGKYRRKKIHHTMRNEQGTKKSSIFLMLAKFITMTMGYFLQLLSACLSYLLH